MTALLRNIFSFLSLLAATQNARADMRDACMNTVSVYVISSQIEELIRADERRKELPREVVERWFRGCSFDEAKEKLAAAGFNVGEYDKITSWESKRGVKR